MSDPALTRIRRFSQGVWIVGALATAVAAFVVMPQVAILDDGSVYIAGGERGLPERIHPFYEENPVELTVTDGVITGDLHGGWIPFAADAQPLLIRRVPEQTADDDLDDYIRIYQTTRLPPDGERADAPTAIGGLYDSEDVAYATPGMNDGRLWFSVTRAGWRLTAEPVQATPLVDAAATGSGDTLLSYRGDALSAKISHTGPGFLRVTVYSPEGEDRGEPAVNDVDDFSTRTSWGEPGTVLFKIESSGGDWSVAVDE